MRGRLPRAFLRRRGVHGPVPARSGPDAPAPSGRGRAPVHGRGGDNCQRQPLPARRAAPRARFSRDRRRRPRARAGARHRARRAGDPILERAAGIRARACISVRARLRHHGGARLVRRGARRPPGAAASRLDLARRRDPRDDRPARCAGRSGRTVRCATGPAVDGAAARLQPRAQRPDRAVARAEPRLPRHDAARRRRVHRLSHPRRRAALHRRRGPARPRGPPAPERRVRSAAARRGEDRDPEGDPPQAGQAHAGRVDRDGDAHDRGPAHARSRRRSAGRGRADRALLARALGRRRLPGRPERRADPARVEHRLGVRRLQRHDDGPSLPTCAESRDGARRAPLRAWHAVLPACGRRAHRADRRGPRDGGPGDDRRGDRAPHRHRAG